MAFTAYDGFQQTVDISIDPDGAGATASASIKCLWSFVTVTIFQQLFSYATFCSAQWEEVRAGMMGASFTLAGYVGGSVTYSKPGSLMGLGTTSTLTIQYGTGCTMVFNPQIASDENSVGAFAASARAVTGRANGAVTVTWVVV